MNVISSSSPIVNDLVIAPVLPIILTFPSTTNFSEGESVLIPTLPLVVPLPCMYKSGVPAAPAACPTKNLI